MAKTIARRDRPLVQRRDFLGPRAGQRDRKISTDRGRTGRRENPGRYGNASRRRALAIGVFGQFFPSAGSPGNRNDFVVIAVDRGNIIRRRAQNPDFADVQCRRRCQGPRGSTCGARTVAALRGAGPDCHRLSARYALASVRVNVVTLKVWPAANTTLSTVISPPPPVAVTLP